MGQSWPLRLMTESSLAVVITVLMVFTMMFDLNLSNAAFCCQVYFCRSLGGCNGCCGFLVNEWHRARGATNGADPGGMCGLLLEVAVRDGS